jgi:ATP-binding cassette subfamily F protein 3
VVIVSHDMHLLGLVADRLWLVKGGRVAPYEGDLEAYRAELLSGEAKDEGRPAKAAKAARQAGRYGAKAGGAAAARPARDRLPDLRAEVRRCEARVEKIQQMHGKLSAKLADPALYEDDRAADLAVWNRKFAEVEEGLARAEALWMAAMEALDRAERGAA